VLPLFDAIEDDADHRHRARAAAAAAPCPSIRMRHSPNGAHVDRRAARSPGWTDGYRVEGGPQRARPARASPAIRSTCRDGLRVTTNDGYLEPARGRPNLTIRGGALVDRVLFDGTRARGVRVRFGDRWEEIEGREIVLCAGAIHSPAILMRSGIGPAAALRALGIRVEADQPAVGQGLMDHPILRASIDLRPGFRAAGADARHTNCCLTYSSGLAGGGERDMIMIAYNHRGLSADGAPMPQGAVGVALYDAFSRGSLRLVSADPDAQPEVDENMLDDPRDRLRMRDGVRRLARLVALAPIAGIAGRITFGDSGLPFAEAAALEDDALDALMLREAGDIQHAAGTCRMSAHEDPRGVVDPDLRVRGVGGLRVADASVMPADCRANLHFTCVMIGENLARRMRSAG
jgi:choline dehydrogenase-like flavoprotein